MAASGSLTAADLPDGYNVKAVEGAWKADTAVSSTATPSIDANEDDLLIAWCVHWDFNDVGEDITGVSGCGQTFTKLVDFPISDGTHRTHHDVWYAFCDNTATSGSVTMTASDTGTQIIQVVRLTGAEVDGTLAYYTDWANDQNPYEDATLTTRDDHLQIVGLWHRNETIDWVDSANANDSDYWQWSVNRRDGTSDATHPVHSLLCTAGTSKLRDFGAFDATAYWSSIWVQVPPAKTHVQVQPVAAQMGMTSATVTDLWAEQAEPSEADYDIGAGNVGTFITGSDYTARMIYLEWDVSDYYGYRAESAGIMMAVADADDAATPHADPELKLWNWGDSYENLSKAPWRAADDQKNTDASIARWNRGHIDAGAVDASSLLTQNPRQMEPYRASAAAPTKQRDLLSEVNTCLKERRPLRGYVTTFDIRNKTTPANTSILAFKTVADGYNSFNLNMVVHAVLESDVATAAPTITVDVVKEISVAVDVATAAPTVTVPNFGGGVMAFDVATAAPTITVSIRRTFLRENLTGRPLAAHRHGRILE